MLDAKGLVALWREGLGAQKALYYYVQGKTFGYQSHPQLERFKATQDPVASIVAYMQVVYNESIERGYTFNQSLILSGFPVTVKELIPVTSGQIDYEIEWLESKLTQRSPADLNRLMKPALHPLFNEVPGGIESWERIQDI
jgi:hypothetical protein